MRPEIPTDRTSFEIPSSYQLPLELLGIIDAMKLVFNFPKINSLLKGNGEKILVIPGYNADDNFLYPMRYFLNKLGYNSKGWELGRNEGDVPLLLKILNEKIYSEFNIHKEKISIIGWSLGGYLAREIARDNPSLVNKVITLGSPIVGGPKYTSISKQYMEGRIDLDELEKEIDQRYEVPIPNPILVIYSKSDNIVSWNACIDVYSPNVIHKEVNSTHIGLIVNTEVYKSIAEFLSR
ncbi:MAG: hypothetical protein SFU98_05580 [Leptospiraceae bacterium]|nr:hypothetical protein [Leptospiraceae bacterium]